MNYDSQSGSPRIKAIKLNIFSVLSFIFGMMAVFSISTLIFSIGLGALAVIFATLSKGYEKRLNPVSRNGFILGLSSLIISLVICFSAVYLYTNNQEYHDKFNQLYEQLYGVSFDEYSQELFGNPTDSSY